jgi:hypothetical protein
MFGVLCNFTQLVALKPDIDITAAVSRYLIIGSNRIKWAVHVAHEESSFGGPRGQENHQIFQTLFGTPTGLFFSGYLTLFQWVPDLISVGT